MLNIKEIALKVVAAQSRFRIGMPAGLTQDFAEALIESYKAELLKEVGEPFGYMMPHYEEMPPIFRRHPLPKGHSPLFASETLYTSDQVAAAILKATEPLDKPIDTALAAEIERTDWTPAEALQFYADQRNFDIVGGHARIIDNGAVASNALKHLSIDRLELKGDAELAELRAQLAASQAYAEQLRGLIEALWDIIDDIDSYGDMAKADDKLFRSLVEKRQKDRWETGITTDGYVLNMPIPHSTSALDAYIAEKVKEAEARIGNKSPCYQIARDIAVRMWERHYKDDAPNWQPLDDFMGVLSQISNMLTGLGKVEGLTRQRDLAVAALEAIAGRRMFIDNLASNVDIAVMTLDVIKGSEK